MQGSSTTTNLIESLDIISCGFRDKVTSATVFFDFAKAFDSVSHPKLLHKLSCFGLPVNLLKSIESFLSNRYQAVRVANTMSSTMPVCSGIPQGSVLGPLLFVIFVNDLPDCLSADAKSKLFADDLKLIQCLHSSDDLEVLQSNVNSVLKWSTDWQLPIALHKCAVIIYGKQ